MTKSYSPRFDPLSLRNRSGLRAIERSIYREEENEIDFEYGEGVMRARNCGQRMCSFRGRRTDPPF